jgi:hypothetical protein
MYRLGLLMHFSELQIVREEGRGIVVLAIAEERKIPLLGCKIEK